MRTPIVIALTFAMAACTSTSDVVPMGNGVYMVSATSHGMLSGGEGNETADALKAANAYCDKQGKQMVARQADRQGAGMQAGVGIAITGSVEFTCESR